MPDKRPSVKNREAVRGPQRKGMSKERAARIANSPGASSRGGEKSGSGGTAKQGGTTAQKKNAAKGWQGLGSEEIVITRCPSPGSDS